MKKIVYVLTIFCSIQFSPIWAQIDWIKQAGDTQKGDNGFSVAIDSKGNIYSTGNFSGTANFGKDIVVSSSFDSDCYLAKSDKDGNFLWVKTIGGKWGQTGNCVVVDNEDNIVLTGGAGLTTIIENIEYENNRGGGIFLVKYNTNGDLLWRKLYQDKSFADSQTLTTDKENNIVFSGRFENIDFDDNILTSNGQVDIFLTKLNKDGDFLWTRNIGGNDDDSPSAVLIDSKGEIVLSGEIRNQITIDDKTIVANEYDDVFVSKFSKSGKLIWIKSFGGGHFDRVWDMAIDNLDNIYVTGDFIDSIYVEGKIILPEPNCHSNAYLIKYSSDSKLVWFKKFKSTGSNLCQSVTIDSKRNCYLAGYFYDDIKIGIYLLENTLQEGKGFIAKINKRGKINKAFMLPGEGMTEIWEMRYSQIDNKLVGLGRFSKKIIFSSNLTLETENDNDILLLKINTKMKKSR